MDLVTTKYAPLKYVIDSSLKFDTIIETIFNVIKTIDEQIVNGLTIPEHDIFGSLDYQSLSMLLHRLYAIQSSGKSFSDLRWILVRRISHPNTDDVIFDEPLIITYYTSSDSSVSIKIYTPFNDDDDCGALTYKYKNILAETMPGISDQCFEPPVVTVKKEITAMCYNITFDCLQNQLKLKFKTEPKREIPHPKVSIETNP